ncbi:MAG: hypothetical protein LQ342_002961 [Letrouitia transgressa]|nr:MAG: hypothetical protein LQ342_002961 [Letrouitia transgressa]
MGVDSKNLIYESKEPAFLRKLKGNFDHGGSLHGVQPQARPRKRRSSDQGEDYEPTYVDGESHEELSKSEVEALAGDMRGKDQCNDEKQNQEMPTGAAFKTDFLDLEQKPRTSSKQQVATIGLSRRKRPIKVVGNDVHDDDSTRPKQDDKPTSKSKTTNSKKTKKVKLSFEEEA